MNPKRKNLRVIISSDMHYSIADLERHTVKSNYYGIDNEQRLQHWVDSIKKEHESCPIDLLLIAGDVTFDLCDKRGTMTCGLGSTVEPFMQKYLAQLPPEIPYYVLPGNHDPHYEENWLRMTGSHRQGYVALEKDLFIMLDTFPEGLEENYDTVKGTPYVPVNVEFVKETMAKYPTHRVWLVAHWIQYTGESAEFKALVRENDRIIGCFVGHSHQSRILPMGEEYANKCVAQTGHYSYSYY